MNIIDTLLLLLLTGFLAWEIDMTKPKPYSLGNTGDTLMIRITGYEFCPSNCDVDHFHTGHFDNYDCEYVPCEHITINEKWLRKTYNTSLDGYYGIFYLWNVDRR